MYMAKRAKMMDGRWAGKARKKAMDPILIATEDALATLLWMAILSKTPARLPAM